VGKREQGEERRGGEERRRGRGEENELELVMEKPASRSARFLWLSSTLGPGEGPKKGQG
jgi:hypothetical protein